MKYIERNFTFLIKNQIYLYNVEKERVQSLTSRENCIIQLFLKFTFLKIM